PARRVPLRGTQRYAKKNSSGLLLCLPGLAIQPSTDASVRKLARQLSAFLCVFPFPLRSLRQTPWSPAEGRLWRERRAVVERKQLAGGKARPGLVVGQRLGGD